MVVSDRAFQEQAESLQLQPAPPTILWVPSSLSKTGRRKTFFVGLMKYNRISGKEEEEDLG